MDINNRRKSLEITIYLFVIIIACMLFLSACTIDSIISISGPEGTIEVAIGEFKYEDYKITLTRESGKTEEVVLTADMVNASDQLKIYKAGTHVIKITYKDLTCEMTIKVSRYSFSGAVLPSITTTYDGQPHSTSVTGTPEGTLITYAPANTFTSAGEYVVQATLSKDDYATTVLTANVIIHKADYDLSGVVFDDVVYEYDGELKTLLVSGDLPKGVVVNYLINGAKGNTASEAGTYNITASFTGDSINYNPIEDMTAVLKINKAKIDVSNLAFEDLTVTYDKQQHSILIDESKLPDKVQVTYENNQQVNAGVYEIKANFVMLDLFNYESIPTATAILTIEKAPYNVSNIYLDSKSVVYDGKAHEIKYSGKLPDGITGVTYHINDEIGNSATEVGTYSIVATFHNGDSNYQDIPDYTATLTITKAQINISALSFNNLAYFYDGTDQDFIAIAENIPSGIASIEYTYWKTNTDPTISVDNMYSYTFVDGEATTSQIVNGYVPKITESGHYVVVGKIIPTGNYNETENIYAQIKVYDIADAKFGYFDGDNELESIDFDNAEHNIEPTGLPNGVTFSVIQYYFALDEQFARSVKDIITLDYTAVIGKDSDNNDITGEGYVVRAIKNAGWYISVASLTDDDGYMLTNDYLLKNLIFVEQIEISLKDYDVVLGLSGNDNGSDFMDVVNNDTMYQYFYRPYSSMDYNLSICSANEVDENGNPIQGVDNVLGDVGVSRVFYSITYEDTYFIGSQKFVKSVFSTENVFNHVGVYTVIVGFETDTINSTINDYLFATVTITKRDLTVTMDGDINAPVEVDYTGTSVTMAIHEILPYSVLINYTYQEYNPVTHMAFGPEYSGNTFVSAGYYVVTATIMSADYGINGSESDVNYVYGYLTIHKANNEWRTNLLDSYEISYTGSGVRTGTDYYATSKFGTVSYIFYTDSAGTNSTTVPTELGNSGVYYIKAVVEGTDNYDGLESSIIYFKINKAIPKWLKALSSFTVAYDGNAIAPGVDFEEPTISSQGEITYHYYQLLNTEEYSEIGVPVNVGTYYIRVEVGETDNYSSIWTEYISFTITKARNHFVTYLNESYSFDITDEITYEATAEFGEVVYKFYSDSVESAYLSSTLPAHIGNYYIKAIVEGTANYYALESGFIPFNINAIPLEWQNLPESITVAYDGEGIAFGEDYNFTATPDGSIVCTYYSDMNGTQCETPINAGTYYVKAVATSTSGNYSAIETGYIPISINPIELNINWSTSTGWSDFTTTYDGTLKQVVPQVENQASIVSGDNLGVSIANNEYTNAGSYVATYSITNTNYTLTNATREWTINKRDISSATINISSDSYEWTGNQITPDVISVQINDLVVDDEYQVSYNNHINLGTATMTVTITTEVNFIGTVSRTFNIVQATNTFTTALVDTEVPYDGSPVEAGVDYTAVAKFGTVRYEFYINAGFVLLSAPPEEAGYYKVRAIVDGTNEYSGLVSEKFNFTITEATNVWTTEVTIDDLTYTGLQLVVGEDVFAEARFGDVTYLFYSDTNGTGISAPIDAGTYYVKAKVFETANYSGLESDYKSFSIVAATNEILNITSLEVPYDGSPVEAGVDYSATAKFGTVQYQFYSDTNGTTISVPKDAGTYYFKAFVEGTTNYSAASTDYTSFTITKTNLTITANDNTIYYGDAPANNGITSSGFVNSETESDLGGTLIYAYTYSQNDNIGSYSITPSGVTSNNYNITFNAGTLTVSPKVITINWVTDDFTYDGTEQTITASYQDVNDSTIQLNVNVDNTFTNAGNYTATASFANNETNYALPVVVTKSYTMKKASLTVNEPVRTWGLEYSGVGQDLIYAGSVINNLGVMEYSLDNENYSTTVPQGKDAGTYDVWYRVIGDANHNDVSSVKLDPITIATVDLEIKAYTKTIYYGDAPSNNGIIGIGFVNNETVAVLGGTLEYAYTYNQYDNIGDYEIIPSGLTSSNYDITFYASVLHVYPKVITIDWVTDDFTYDGTEQTITASYQDVNDSTVQLNVNVDNTFTNAGNYTATVSFANGETNYALPTVVTKSYTMKKSNLTITANDNTIYYGDAPANNGITSSGFVNSETESDLGGTLTYAYTYSQNDNIGSYSITPSGLTSNNYNITFNAGTLTVSPKVITINWITDDFTYDGTEQTITASYQDVNDSTVQLNVNVDNTFTNAGNYTATVSFANGETNYALPTVVTKSYTMKKADISFVAPTEIQNLVEDGNPQDLITPGSVTGVGTMQYSLDGENYSTTVPQGTDAGTYHVWYRVIGDANHSDVSPVEIVVTIIIETQCEP